MGRCFWCITSDISTEPYYTIYDLHFSVIFVVVVVIVCHRQLYTVAVSSSSCAIYFSTGINKINHTYVNKCLMVAERVHSWKKHWRRKRKREKSTHRGWEVLVSLDNERGELLLKMYSQCFSVLVIFFSLF